MSETTILLLNFLFVLLLSKEKTTDGDDKKVIAFINTYNPRNPHVFPRILNCLAILNESPRMKNIMDNAKIISSQRQPPNLKSILTQSNFSSQEKEKGISKCGDPLCGNCPYMMEGRSIQMET